MKNLARYLTHTLRKSNAPIFTIAAALGMAMCCSTARGQSGAGSIQGTVTDSTGAVIAGAAIHVVNQATDVATDAKSSSIGFYQVPDLFTGAYAMTVSAPGFKTYTTRIELLVNQNAVINPALAVGSQAEQITVSANVVQLTTTDSGTIFSTLENDRINQLPMNGRDLLTLTGESTPGLGSCSQQGAGACPNGLAAQAMEYVADGVTTTNRQFGGEQAEEPGTALNSQLPDPDAIQEVQVETTGVGAQYSTPAVGIITTKSGTNSLHGAMFETARNNYWGIAKVRQNPSTYAAPTYIRNEFGASVGGPIILPHVYHGKNKSFWFFAYERYSLASISNQEEAVPPASWEQGNFSGLLNSSGVLQQLYDPATTTANAACPVPTGGTTNNPYCRTSFTSEYNETGSNINSIPSNRLSPTAKVYFDITPPASSAANPLVTTNLEGVDPTEIRVPTITFRLDHVFDDNNRAYLRYTDNLGTLTTLLSAAAEGQVNPQPATIAADGFPAFLSGMSSTPGTMFNAAIGYTHVFSPMFFAETVVSQEWWGQPLGPLGNPSADYESKLGLPNNFGESGFPTWSGLLDPYKGQQWAYGNNQIILNVDENLTKTIGRHQLQFGGRYRHERIGTRPDESPDTITFGAYATGLLNPATITSNTYTATTNTGNANADLLLGAPYSYNVNLDPPYEHYHDMEFDGYFQDNYHVSRNLTVNLGLRYEAHPAPWEKYGAMAGFDLKNDARVTAVPTSTLISEGYTTQAIITNDENDGAKFETPQEAGMPPTIIKNSDLTVGPRVGLAYQPFGAKYGTVIRGAYGRYIYPIPIRFALIQVNKSNPFTASYTEDYTNAAQSPDGLPNYILRSPQSVVMGVNSSGVVNSSSTTSILPGITELSLDPDLKPDFASQTNFTIEQPLKGNSVLRVSWLWTHGSNLDQEYYYNFHPTSYVWEMQTGITPPNGGASTIGTNQYATTATGPYDQTTWGGSGYQVQTTGWSNDNILQANYQRLFHRGIAYQIIYAWSKAFRVGGAHALANYYYPPADFVGNTQGAANTYMTPAYGPVIAPALPPPSPAGLRDWASFRALDSFESYMVDTAVPKQYIQFNGIIDLPFGSGKRFLGNANHLINELVGGWQVAGDGTIVSQDFSITATNWGLTNPLHVYKNKAPITDCRSGVCYKEWEWFNGYIAPTANANVDCTTKCVTGLPSNWAPYQTPIDNTPGTTYYGNNEVEITLANGKTSAITYAPGPSTAITGGNGPVGENPFAHTVLNGPMNWTADASLFKVFPIKEGVNLRFNMDAFNVFNVQGYNNPNATDGTVNFLSSYNTARQVQFTLRLTF
jgi:hypothetical protein